MDVGCTEQAFVAAYHFLYVVIGRIDDPDLAPEIFSASHCTAIFFPSHRNGWFSPWWTPILLMQEDQCTMVCSSVAHLTLKWKWANSLRTMDRARFTRADASPTHCLLDISPMLPECDPMVRLIRTGPLSQDGWAKVAKQHKQFTMPRFARWCFSASLNIILSHDIVWEF